MQSNLINKNKNDNMIEDLLTNTDVTSCVKNGINEEMVLKAEKTGKFLADCKLTTSQIRNIFGEMRRIQMNGYEKEKASFILLKPKLAYTVKRNFNKGIEKFYEIFCWGYDAIDKSNDNEGKCQFQNFLNLLEAILAYHKYYGGKE